MAKLDGNKLVVKENRLINASYDLTLQEKRLILWLVSELGPSDKEFQEYRVNIAELADFIGMETAGNLYSRMQELTKKLMSRVLEIEKPDGSELLQVNWISSAHYRRGMGCVDISLSPKLMPYLLEIKRNYTKYQLKHAIAMKSAHAIRIYELLKQYEGLGERVVSLDGIRSVCGMKKGQYKLYADIRISVIEIAQREINERTDIEFDYEPVKEGRKVVAIRFTIRQNAKAQEIDPIRDDPALARYLYRLTQNGVAEDRARELLEAHSLEVVAWALDELARRLKARDKIENPAGWLIEAISNDWRPQPSLFEREEQAKREQARKAEARRAEIEATLEPVRAGYRDARRTKVAEYGGRVDVLPKAARVALHDAFRDHLAKQPGGTIFAGRFVGGQSWTEPGTIPHAVAFFREQFEDFDFPATEQEYAETNGCPEFADLTAELRGLGTSP